MSIKTLTLSIVFLSVVGCSSGNGAESAHAPVPVYNQAYQENYAADTMDEILAQARNAYVLVDPFAEGVTEYLSRIKENSNQIAGYISAGTGENWRGDFTELKPYLTAKEWPEWPGEFYVSQVTTGIVNIMEKRIDKMAAWGMEWVEFDNMDWLDSQTKKSFNLEATEAEAKTYINTLCRYAHDKKMKCMAKNTVEGFENFDGVLYESYSDNKNWWDTAGAQSFLKAGKLVIVNHYNESDCDGTYAWYKNLYHTKRLSFICEDVRTKKYVHYNQ